LACVSTTPFGWPVLPEVYCRKPVWPAVARTGVKEAFSEKSAGTITARSVSTCARSSQAIALASGIVTISAAPQLLRMPTWRVRWSSMVVRRAGG
jgi:hypothetical protein